MLLSLPLTVAVPAAYTRIVFLVFGPESSAWPREVGETVKHNPPASWTGRIEWLVMMAPRAAALVAVLLITKRGENDSTIARLRSRSAARILAGAGLFLLVGVTAIAMHGWHGFWWKMSMVAMTILDFLCAAVALATLSYVTHLLRRAPRPVLVKFSRLLLSLLFPLGAVWLALGAAGLIMCLTQPGPVGLPCAWPVSVPAAGGTTTSPASAPATARTTKYIVMDERLGMTMTTTAPAFMLERWQEYERALQQDQQRLSFWVDVYLMIRAYSIVPGALWGCCVLALLALLWWTLHRAVQENAKLDQGSP